ncbi:hypothetical protein VR610_03585 [Aquirufa regiilacus]
MRKNTTQDAILFLVHIIGMLVFLIMCFVNQDPIFDKLFISLLIILALNLLKLMQTPY